MQIKSSLFFVVLLFFSLKLIGQENYVIEPYRPEQPALHNKIVEMDSLLFDAYNTCKISDFESFISEDIEFYHDRGGMNSSKTDIVESIKNNICGKVTRELLPGSIEVYPIPGFGAVQMGLHRFQSISDQGTHTSRYSKFVHTWKKSGNTWLVVRIISLH